MTPEERMMDLEVRLARQEDLVDTLNQTVYRQQTKLDELETLVSALAGRIKEVAAAIGDAPLNERPPHY